MRILVASSNPGKQREYEAMAAGHDSAFALLPDFASLPAFDESAPTFAENAAGKALRYSRFASEPVIADDSGLVVPALGGAPGVNSARYAGPGACDADRVAKLLAELRSRYRQRPAGREQSRQDAADTDARFVCVLALAQQGRVLAVFSDFVEGVLLDAPRGAGGFGYDPIFLYPPLGKTFAELQREEKNRISHRGKAFRKLLDYPVLCGL